MRELAILTFVSLDGVMQGPSGPDEDPSGGFTRGGWAQACWDAVMEQVKVEAMAEPYDLLLGRTTYELFAAGAPEASDPLSIMLNNATKYVVTSAPGNLEWQNSVVVGGDIAGEIAKLKDQDGPLLQVHGSGELIQLLLAHGLIDEFRLWTFPVLVGSGKRLFDSGCVPTDLSLVKTATTPGGATMSIYRRAAAG
ncbi:MAG: dihydrofolate reductase family protein [Acidimicrobiales bacterium]